MRRMKWIFGSAFGIAALCLTIGSTAVPASPLDVVPDDEAASVVGGQTPCGWNVIIKDNLGCGQPSKYDSSGQAYEWCPIAVHRSPDGTRGSLCVLSRWCSNCGNNCNMHDDTQPLCYVVATPSQP